MRRAARAVDHAAALVLIALVRLYQLLLSPLVGPVCRYAPSCSSYAAQALAERGALVGSCLTARRLLRCHPWARGGWDPVPSGGAHTGAGAGCRAAGAAPQPSPDLARTP